MARWPWNKTESASTVVDVVEEQPEVQETVISEPIKPKEPAPMPTCGPVRAPSLQSEEREEYKRVAEAIGIDCCTDLIREKLRACLTEENIHTYNYPQVVNYLDDKLGADWEWRGLRTMDTEHLKGCYLKGCYLPAEKSHRKVLFADEPYRGAVPLPVLLTVQKICKAVPEVHFYVSCPKGADGDPFLMVINRQLGPHVVERWDEPNFRER
jgi:hypothetical protein